MCHRKKTREFQRNIYFCFIDYSKAFDCVDHNKLWKVLKETVIPDHLTCLLRNLYADQATSVRTTRNNGLVQNWEGSMLKLYVVTLLNMRSISHEMPGWVNHKLKSRLTGEITTTSNIQVAPLKWQKAKRN